MPRSLPALTSWLAGSREALEPDLPIIDPHHHVWHDERDRYLMDELLTDLSTGHNVMSTVFVQVKAMYRADGPESMRPIGEVEFANGIAAASASGHFGKVRLHQGIVGYGDLLLGDAVQSTLEGAIAAGNGRFRGVRQGATWDDGSAAHGRSFARRHLLRDTVFRRGFARLAPVGLSFV